MGTGRGGTTFLFARVAGPGSVLVTVDRATDPPFALALPRLAPPGGRIVALQADSHAAATVEAVRAAAGGPVDFLFLDGDHSYEGVRDDFEAYSPLVRPGGLVAFHDVVPDHAQRGGPPTGRSTGGVPRFWAELCAARPAACEEIVEDHSQDGFGIGVLRM
jgi:predicted O-methyltransferase YrrM